MTLFSLLLTLGALLFVVRACLLEGMRAAPWGIALVVLWLGAAAGGLTFAAWQAELPAFPWLDVLLVTVAALGGVGLIRDWKRLGRASVDLAYYQGVVRELEQRHDHHEAAEREGHVAGVGRGHEDGAA